MSRLAILCVVLAGWTSGQLAVSLRAETAAPPYRVGASTDNYPYSYTGPDGKVTGFGVDLLDALAARMNLQIQRVALPGMEERERFATGDFEIRQLHARTSESLDDAEYSLPVLVVRGTLFARRGEKRFSSLEDVRRLGLRVAAPPQGHSFALSQNLAPNHLIRASSGECLRMLAAGEVDAALVTRLTGLAQAKHLGISNLEPVGPVIDGFTVRYSIATRRGNTELMGVINEGLAALYQTGEYERIYEKWFGRHEDKAGVTRQELMVYTGAALALGFIAALVALLRQRALARKLATQAAELAESRAALAEAQRFARVGHWKRSLTAQQTSIWSDETYRIFGRNPAEGVPSRDQLVEYAVPDDRPRWSEILRRASDEGIDYDCDVTIVTPAGDRRIVHVRGSPVVDARGQRIAVFGTAQDVTDWRLAEQARRQTEQLLRVLYDNLPLAMSVVEFREGDWFIVSLNRESLRGLRLSTQPPPETRIRDLPTLPDAAAFWENLGRRCLESGAVQTTEIQRSDPLRNFAVRALPLAGGLHPRVCFIAEEITERKRQDAEIAQSRRLRAIGELVGGIAHEFNNLLTPVALNAQMLQSEWAHEPALVAQLKVISEAARRSAELTRRLLTFGRKSESRAEVLALRTLIENDLDLIRRTIDRRIEVSCQLPADLQSLYLDSGDVHQVLLNLLFNARDTLQERLALPAEPGFTPRIEIAAAVLPASAAQPIAVRGRAAPEKWVRVTVRDTGMGMSAEVVERVFEPFYTTKEVGRGTGLGLATVWHVLAELGGRIDVESKPGVGSAFHVYLPVRPAPASDVAAPAASAAPASNAKRILLVEDEEAVAHVVQALLKRQGHTITHAADGSLGWEKLAANVSAFDLAMFDLNMPGLHGRELVKRARAVKFAGPIIVMSGRVPDTERDELLASGADAILDKPFSIEELQRTLAQVTTGARV